MRRWVNVELTEAQAAEFREFLRLFAVKFETSACFNLVHFEVYANDEEIAACNQMLDAIA